MKTNGITVLMPCFNHEEYIEQAIESVLSQIVDIPVKLLIFDDCSTDKTLNIVRSKYKLYPHLISVYENKNNLGSGLKSYIAHNLYVDTEFWCTLEGDDYWSTNNKLQTQVDILRADSNRVGCAGFTSHLTRGESDVLIGSTLQEFNLVDCALYDDVVLFYVHTSSILWRNLYRYKGMPFPKRFWNLKGDPALMQAMMGKNHSLYRLDSVLSVYRNTGKGRWSSLSSEEQLQYNCKYAKLLLRDLPLKYKIIRFLKSRANSDLLTWFISKGLLPSPINKSL